MRIIYQLLYIGLILPHIIFSQTWIDKNENTNYVRRHECSFLQSGDTFIMFGGREQATRLDIYDYANNTWSQGASAPLEFNHFQAMQYEGFVWVIGAFKTNNFPNETPVENIYLFHPALNVWIQGPEIPLSRRRGGAGVVLYNDKFYLIAGNTIGHNGGFVPWFDMYDPVNNIWQQLGDAPRARDHFAAALINNKVYAASGRLSGGTGGVFAPLVEEVDVFDFNTDSWTTLPSSKNIPTPRAGASVVAFQNEIYIMGGEGTSSGPAFKIVEAYNPSTDSWSSKADMNYNRHGTQAIVSGNGIFIAGGSPVLGGGNQHNMEVYNQDAPTGTTITASTLTADNMVTFAPNETKNIAISTSGGNAGCFITDTAISGTDAAEFSISGDLKNHLIKANSTQNITVTSSTQEPNKTATLTLTYDDGKTVIIDLQTSDILSVSEIEAASKEVLLYPNPSNKVLFIDTKKPVKNMVIFTIQGEKIKPLYHTSEKKMTKVEISTQFLSPGTYVLKLISGDNSISFKRFLKK